MTNKCRFTKLDCIHPGATPDDPYDKKKCIVYQAYKNGMLYGLEEIVYWEDGEIAIDDAEYEFLMGQIEGDNL